MNLSEKLTAIGYKMNKAKEVSDWYLNLSKTQNGFTYIGEYKYLNHLNKVKEGPNLSSNLSLYTINLPKAKL